MNRIHSFSIVAPPGDDGERREISVDEDIPILSNILIRTHSVIRGDAEFMPNLPPDGIRELLVLLEIHRVQYQGGDDDVEAGAANA